MDSAYYLAENWGEVNVSALPGVGLINDLSYGFLWHACF